MTEGNPETVKFKPAAEMIISDLETLKVVADPLRLSIIELLAKPSTVKRVANKIGKPPTKLYYHINLLEKHNLIQMVDTRIVSGIVEKHYQTAAQNFRVSRDLLTPSSEGFDESFDVILGGIWTDAREDLRDSLLAGIAIPDEDAPIHKQMRFSRARMWLSPEKAEAFYNRMQEVMEEFRGWDEEEQQPDAPDAQPYSLLYLLHPTSRSRDHEADGKDTNSTDEA